MNDFCENFKTDIEIFLGASINTENLHDTKIASAMRYSLLNGGKRIRGALLLAFYQLITGNEKYLPALPFAGAIEMIHTYSLIHDDLPCMDDDEIRRGKPACHIEFGEAVALLAGDALLTNAFEMISDQMKFVHPLNQLRAINILSKSSGHCGMVGGQMMDLENENSNITIERLETTDRKKTGELFSAACGIGVVVANGDTFSIKLAMNFGEKLGIAFQIIDDILDCTADCTALGKPIKSDQKNSKNTYVSLLGLGAAKEMAKFYTNEALKNLDEFNTNSYNLSPYIRDIKNFALSLMDRGF